MKKMTEVYSIEPLVIKIPYEIEYRHSYGETSPFFLNIAQGKLTATRCDHCKMTYLPPRGDCPICLRETRWIEIPDVGRVHSFSTMFFAGEKFLKDIPFSLAYIEFDGVDTVFLTRLKTNDPKKLKIGMKVKMHMSRDVEWKASDVWAEPI
jgi:uncharacterized OB-fold protein